MKRAIIVLFCLLFVTLFCACEARENTNAESEGPIVCDTTGVIPNEVTNEATDEVTGDSPSPQGEETDPVLWSFADPLNDLTLIRAYAGDDGELTLFLPSSLSLDAVPLFFSDGLIELTGGKGTRLTLASGEKADLTVFPGDGRTEAVCEYHIGDISGTLTVLKSENIDAMFLVSDDPVNCGRSWVEASKDHSAKAKGSMTLLDPAGNTVYSGSLTQIKGRGNTTWAMPKRPYQLKLDQKADLPETGNSANDSKTWLLLANFLDASMIRNDLIFDISRALGLEDTPEYAHTDLWYDGEYRGSYLITEKVEIGSGRVDVTDLEKAIEDLNPEYDFDAPAVKQDVTPWGTKMQYVDGISDPEDISGGYILEMESESRIQSEVSWFETRNGDFLYVRSPEALSRDALIYIAGVYQSFEDAVCNGGYDPETGKHYTDFVDFESLVRCYIAMEVSGNSECYVNSTFFYKDAGDEKLRCGPMWDYDLSLSVLQTEIRAGKTRLGSALTALPDFSARVEKVYRELLYPLLGEFISPDGRIEDLRNTLSASARMNYTLWPYRSYTGEAQGGDGFDENVDYVINYLSERRQFLLTAFEESVSGRRDGSDRKG